MPALPTADRIEVIPNTVAATGTHSEPGLRLKTVAIDFHRLTAKVLCTLDYGTVVSPPVHQRQKNKNYSVLMTH